MDEDNPDYLVHEIFTQNFWKDHPLGKPILGTKETVKRFERPSVVEAYGHRFAPGNIVVSAAGNLDHDRICRPRHKAFEHMKPRKNGFHSSAPKIVSRIILRNKKALEQVQLCIGVPASHRPREAPRRLHSQHPARRRHEFPPLPEYPRTPGSGLLHLQRSQSLSRHRMPRVYAGTSLASASKVVQSVVSEFRKLKVEPVPEEELSRSKAQLKGSLMLSLESSTARMSNLARQEMYFDRFYDRRTDRKDRSRNLRGSHQSGQRILQHRNQSPSPPWAISPA